VNSAESIPLFGVDFSSSPTKRKPIVAACGRLGRLNGRTAVCYESLLTMPSLTNFSNWLMQPGPWLAGFDLPFALPYEFLSDLKVRWPCGDWEAHIRHIAALSRPQMVNTFKAFCDARPVGKKFAHRAADLVTGSSPSMKWVNPPVAYMLHAGAPRVLDAGLYVPGLQLPPKNLSTARIALEAYPGYFARGVVGRHSYKSDDVKKQDAARKANRVALVQAMEDGRNSLSLAGKFSAVVKSLCIDDASGDSLDACICLLQAAWGWQRRDDFYGLPRAMHPVEGWIVTAPFEKKIGL
jgi:hypothetical protein